MLFGEKLEPVEGMELKGYVPFMVPGINAKIFGGRYVNYRPLARRMIGVKMAAEIEHPYNISIPTDDFCTPSVEDMTNGMIAAVTAMHKGNDIYAGCMGGTGRTGLFMACMMKVASYMSPGAYPPYLTPVEMVRQWYRPHAVETAEQQEFVADFDIKPVVAAVKCLVKPVFTQVKVVEVEVPAKLGFWGHLRAAWYALRGK